MLGWSVCVCVCVCVCVAACDAECRHEAASCSAGLSLSLSLSLFAFVCVCVCVYDVRAMFGGLWGILIPVNTHTPDPERGRTVACIIKDSLCPFVASWCADKGRDCTIVRGRGEDEKNTVLICKLSRPPVPLRPTDLLDMDCGLLYVPVGPGRR
jgi:hypothetical protein